MNRLLIGLAVALLAAACSGGGDIAATVNGVDIEVEAVETLIDTGDEELTDERFRAILTALVQWEAIAAAAAEEYGIAPSEDEISAYADELFATRGAGMTRADFLTSQQVTEDGFQLSASRLLVEERLLEEFEAAVDVPSVEEAQQIIDDDPKAWTLVCAAHILVGTEEEALAVQGRLDAGEDFAAVAGEVSIDTGSGASGGDLGCTPASRWVEPFGDAAMVAEFGDVTDPVESEFGFHLIRVESRTEATLDQVQETLLEVSKAELADEWFLAAVVDAEITVAEEYGTWVTDPAPSIVAPAS